MENDFDGERARQIPRLYYGSERPSSRQVSPSLTMQQESWGGPSRSSPYPGNLSQPALHDMTDRIDARGSRPSLPPPRTLEREVISMSGLPPSADVYRSSQHPLLHTAAPIPESTSSYREPSYGYAYHHPSRYQSLSAGSVHAFDRTPFTAGGYPTSYPDYAGRSIFGDAGPGGVSGDNKQRKRRGNLPKETTDKLRAWFMAHLQHPYPTEDEKQELMRQTGLQMSKLKGPGLGRFRPNANGYSDQISNWFINARRRQLPTMINNARAESDAMTGVRGGEMKVLATTEHGDFDHLKREAAAGPLSDGDGATYDEDLESLNQHRGANMSRGSV